MSLPPRPYDRSVNSEIERLLYQVSVIQMDARGLAGGLTHQQFNWRPEPGVWSVGQCFDHLNAYHRRWLPLLEEAIERGRAQGLLHPGPYSYGFLSRWFLANMEPPAKRKFKAPRSLEPPPECQPEVVMPEFLALHERFEKLLRAADGLDLARIRVRSPVTRWIRHSLGGSFWLLAAHDRRHIYQAREVCKAPGFPATVFPKIA
jgi:hypothetical protein